MTTMTRVGLVILDFCLIQLENQCKLCVCVWEIVRTEVSASHLLRLSRRYT